MDKTPWATTPTVGGGSPRQIAPLVPATDGCGGDLLVTDLLLTGEQMARHVLDALARREWVDAFLLAAGLQQLADDRLHPDPFSLRRAAAYFRTDGASNAGPRAQVASLAAPAAATASSGLDATRPLGTGIEYRANSCFD